MSIQLSNVAANMPTPTEISKIVLDRNYSSDFLYSPNTLKDSKKEYEEMLNAAYLADWSDEDLEKKETFNESIRNCQNIVAEMAHAAKLAKRTSLDQRSEADCMRVYRLLSKALDAYFAL